MEFNPGDVIYSEVPLLRAYWADCFDGEVNGGARPADPWVTPRRYLIYHTGGRFGSICDRQFSIYATDIGFVPDDVELIWALQASLGEFAIRYPGNEVGWATAEDAITQNADLSLRPGDGGFYLVSTAIGLPYCFFVRPPTEEERALPQADLLTVALAVEGAAEQFARWDRLYDYRTAIFKRYVQTPLPNPQFASDLLTAHAPRRSQTWVSATGYRVWTQSMGTARELARWTDTPLPEHLWWDRLTPAEFTDPRISATRRQPDRTGPRDPAFAFHHKTPRPVRARCMTCGYETSVAAAWAAVGLPQCPSGHQMVPATVLRAPVPA
jgi:hypothetical protein